MAGTKIGGIKARDKNLARDPDFYKKIGHIGGSRGSTGGFASRKDCACDVFPWQHIIAQCAGFKGGLASRRKPKV